MNTSQLKISISAEGESAADILRVLGGNFSGISTIDTRVNTRADAGISSTV